MARRNPQNEEIILFTKQISNYAYNRAYTKPTALSLRKYPVILVFSVFYVPNLNHGPQVQKNNILQFKLMF